MFILNSVFLITGGASGLGKFMAHYFSNKGGIVYISDIADSNGKEIERASKYKIKYIKCDASKEKEVINMFDIIISEQGKIDVVINCAGIMISEPFASESTSFNSGNFKKLWKVNTLSAFLVSKFAAKLMIDKHDPTKDCNGVIILLSSLAVYTSTPGKVGYAASKGALSAITLPIARELGKYKIRVNSIAPGIIETPMTALLKTNQSLSKILLDATPLNCFGKPIHVAQASEYLVKCDFVTGTVIHIDGGLKIPLF
jgi:NAD(P)-dependent dehydrogenase (short-subunit alcohol dehydrogenase family)